MNVRPGTLGAVVLIVVVGFAIGAWLAIRTRGSDVPTTRVTVASNTRTPGPVDTLAPKAKPTSRAAAVSIATAEPTPKPAATAMPTPKPAATETPAATPAPPVPTTAAVASHGSGQALQGSWQLDEVNVQVGTIVWVGDAVLSGGNSIVFNAHKQSVAGRPATRCERQTDLQAAFWLGVAEQTVPYREVNCDGVVSTGEVRVRGFSANDSYFSGSFWRNGTNLGSFSARKL